MFKYEIQGQLKSFFLSTAKSSSEPSKVPVFEEHIDFSCTSANGSGLQQQLSVLTILFCKIDEPSSVR